MGWLINWVVIGTAVALIPASSPVPSESTCYGKSAHGRLEYGVRLPLSGQNYTAYGLVPWVAGRTYVHGTVRSIVIDAYAHLARETPKRVYQYAEAGRRGGGPIEPHKTHQNGLSVDFIVPVKDANGESVHLPTHAFNRYGYDIDFDDQGRFEQYRIDFQALGAHLVALHKTARAHGVAIRRVLLDPRFQPSLYETRYGGYIRRHLHIPEERSWVRHDDHYHVDFAVPCEPMSQH